MRSCLLKLSGAIFSLLLIAAGASHAQGGPASDASAYDAPPGLSRSSVALMNFPFDSRSGAGKLPPGLEGRPAAPGRASYVIIKFRDRFNGAARDRLGKAGVRFFGYVPVDAFLAKVPPGQRNKVAADPAVELVADYAPAYRLQPKLLGLATGETPGAGMMSLIVRGFDDEDLGPVKEAVVSLGGSYEVIVDEPGLNRKLLRVELPAGGIAGLASADGVRWVEEEPEYELHNDVAAPVIEAVPVWNAAFPLKGTGQIVAVCDTGLDTGNTNTMHPDFSGTTSDGYAKIKRAFTYGRTGDWSDFHGHGTHTCGSAVGFGNVTSSIRGMAFDARLVMQSTMTSGGALYIPDLNTTTFPDAYSEGARVSSNSWGSMYSAGQYFYTARMADTFIWEHKDFVAVFSAGNDGADTNPADGVIDPGSVASPSTAKNVITVGASENNRPSVTTNYGHSGYTKPPINSDRLCDNVSGMVAFSGRGPCVDGRRKPDIVAPGTIVLSTKSSVDAVVNYYEYPSYRGYPSYLDQYFLFNSGTSMSAPLVSGSAALVREFLASNGLPGPSAALVKALLINGAYDMTPGQYGTGPTADVTGRPDNNQGWGRLDVKAALYPDLPKRLVYVDEPGGPVTGGSMSYTYTVSDQTQEIRVSLVWTDPPPESAATYQLVNDLDLVVTAPGGTVYHGNRYSGSASIPGDPGFDRVNNVEGVTIPASGVSAGTLTVRVEGYNVVQGPQPFALAITGGFTGPPSVADIDPATGTNNAYTPVTVTGDGFDAGATLVVGGALCQTTGVTQTQIDATVPPGIAAGACEVRVVNPDGQYGALPDGFVVTQDPVAPAAPAGLYASPGNAEIGLKWDPNSEPDLAGYRVYFNSYSTTVGAVDSHRLTGLTNGVTYEITIRALDLAKNMSPAAGPVYATPLLPDPELPHYSWDGSPAWGCSGCHLDDLTGTLLPSGFDFRTDPVLCLSCHNGAAVAHDTPVGPSGSHPMFVNASSGGARAPTFGGVTSGEFSDAMYTHLRGGTDVVCTTCHNPMRKPHDPGRAWEFTSTSDGQRFYAQRGGWWDGGHLRAEAQHDSLLWTPSGSKDRQSLSLGRQAFAFNEYSGTVTLTNQTTGYVYLSLKDPYLRAPGADNTACSDCHAEATHRSLNCLACHGAHGTVNVKGIRSRVRTPAPGYADVVFSRYTGAGSFADGTEPYDGVCEACHTKTAYYRNDGSQPYTNHTSTGVGYGGADCTACHTHANGFSN